MSTPSSGEYWGRGWTDAKANVTKNNPYFGLLAGSTCHLESAKGNVNMSGKCHGKTEELWNVIGFQASLSRLSWPDRK